LINRTLIKGLGPILAEILLKCILLVTDFQKLPSAGAIRPQCPLTFDIILAT